MSRASTRPLHPGAAVLAVLTVSLLGACGGGQTADADPVTTVPPSSRGEAVELSGTTLDGARVDVRQFGGTVVVVNVWGSWCPPCRKEAPELERAYRELRGRGVNFLGIDTRDNVAAARAFVTRYGLSYPSLVDDGPMLLAFRGAVPASAVPTTIIVDGAGRVAARVIGGTDAATVKGLVEDVLAEESSSSSPTTRGTGTKESP